MSRRRVLWVALVFALTLLAELPARWVALVLPLSVQGVSGSLWHGEARQLGDVGPLAWHWQPWRLQAQASAGFQGQRWELTLSGWPWNWQAALQPQASRGTVAAAYRLGGDWQGRIELRGSGSTCRAAAGQLLGNDLALSAPWSLTLGQSQWQVDCANGVHLLGRLSLEGQHQAELDADLLARRGRLQGRVEPGSALHPLLVSAQWLAPDAAQVSRNIRW